MFFHFIVKSYITFLLLSFAFLSIKYFFMCDMFLLYFFNYNAYRVLKELILLYFSLFSLSKKTIVKNSIQQHCCHFIVYVYYFLKVTILSKRLNIFPKLFISSAISWEHSIIILLKLLQFIQNIFAIYFFIVRSKFVNL